jgi:hypothetical protein
MGYPCSRCCIRAVSASAKVASGPVFELGVPAVSDTEFAGVNYSDVAVNVHVLSVVYLRWRVVCLVLCVFQFELCGILVPHGNCEAPFDIIDGAGDIHGVCCVCKHG